MFGVKHCDRWPEHSFGCRARRANVPSGPGHLWQPQHSSDGPAQSIRHHPSHTRHTHAWPRGRGSVRFDHLPLKLTTQTAQQGDVGARCTHSARTVQGFLATFPDFTRWNVCIPCPSRHSEEKNDSEASWQCTPTPPQLWTLCTATLNP